VNPRTGRNASSTNPRDWDTFDNAVAACEASGYAGVGFVLTKEAGYVGVDFDDCLSDASSAPPHGMRPTEYRYLQALDSYAEVSPSGTGFKVVFKGVIPDEVSRRGFGEGNGIYDSSRYFTVTGQTLSGYDTLRSVSPETLAGFLAEIFPPKAAATRRIPLAGEASALLSYRRSCFPSYSAKNDAGTTRP